MRLRLLNIIIIKIGIMLSNKVYIIEVKGKRVRLTKRQLNIICRIMKWPMSFNAIKEIIDVNPTPLVRDLKFLEKEGILKKYTISDNPKRVEYRITKEGEQLATKILRTMIFKKMI
ncbi:MAG: hypothetical protein ARM1_0666 [Candidatus Micrarchaeota archaeon]|nr:MAG: hypothetical protein ARM1_0666 [Candidatus Micrarchaeota archaeon]